MRFDWVDKEGVLLAIIFVLMVIVAWLVLDCSAWTRGEREALAGECEVIRGVIGSNAYVTVHSNGTVFGVRCPGAFYRDRTPGEEAEIEDWLKQLEAK